MEYAGRLGGGYPTIVKYQAGETMATAGVPVEVAGAGGSGLQLVETTTALQVIGLAIDTATVANAQVASNADTARVVSVINNPDAILKANLSGGATAGTALTTGTVDTASTDGLATSTTVDYSSPSLDEGAILCATGPNKGYVRKVTSLSGADAVHILAWPNDTTTSDTMIGLPYGLSGGGRFPIVAMDSQFVQLTSNLAEVDASVAVDTDNVNFLPYRLELPADDNDITTGTKILLLHYDHLYGGQVA